MVAGTTPADPEPPLDMSKYFTRSLMGAQPLAKWRSTPSFGFGKGSRETREKVFISPAHVKGIFGRNSPGPAMYSLPSGSGVQLLSTKHSQPRWAFGTCERFPRSKFEPGPGPGGKPQHPLIAYR